MSAQSFIKDSFKVNYQRLFRSHEHQQVAYEDLIKSIENNQLAKKYLERLEKVIIGE